MHCYMDGVQIFRDIPLSVTFLMLQELLHCYQKLVKYRLPQHHWAGVAIKATRQWYIPHTQVITSTSTVTCSYMYYPHTGHTRMVQLVYQLCRYTTDGHKGLYCHVKTWPSGASPYLEFRMLKIHHCPCQLSTVFVFVIQFESCNATTVAHSITSHRSKTWIE